MEPLDAELLKDLRGLGKDKCEIERNPISLTAVKALGDAHLKCCVKMFYSLASLMTKGSVQTLV